MENLFTPKTLSKIRAYGCPFFREQGLKNRQDKLVFQTRAKNFWPEGIHTYIEKYYARRLHIYD